MRKKIIIISILLITIFLILSILFLIRNGLKNIKLTEYKYKINNIKSWDEVFENPGNISVKPFITGWVNGDSSGSFNKNNPNFKYMDKSIKDVPVLAFWLKHESKGDILIDSGFDKSFYNNTKGNFSLMSSFFQKINGYKNIQYENEDISYHLTKHSITPQMVFITHLHPDHTSGIPAFPKNAEYIMDKNEINFMSKLAAYNNFKGVKEIKTLDFNKSQSIPPFTKSIDVFGDKSLWAVSTCGHTDGHISFVVNSQDGPVLITGDACMDYKSFDYEVEPFSMSEEGMKNTAKSLKMLKDFMKMYPDAVLYVGHDYKSVSL